MLVSDTSNLPKLLLARAFIREPLSRVHGAAVEIVADALSAYDAKGFFEVLTIRNSRRPIAWEGNLPATVVTETIAASEVRAFWIRRQDSTTRRLEFFARFAEHDLPRGSTRISRRLETLSGQDTYHGYRFDVAFLESVQRNSTGMTSTLTRKLGAILQFGGGEAGFVGHATEATVLLGLTDLQRSRGAVSALYSNRWLDIVVNQPADPEYQVALDSKAASMSLVGPSGVERVEPAGEHGESAPQAFCLVARGQEVDQLGGTLLLERVLGARSQELAPGGGWIIEIPLRFPRDNWLTKQMMWPLPMRTWEPWTLRESNGAASAVWFLSPTQESSPRLMLFEGTVDGSGRNPNAVSFEIVLARDDTPSSSRIREILREWSDLSGTDLRIAHQDSKLLRGTIIVEGAALKFVTAAIGLWVRERIVNFKTRIAMFVGHVGEDERQIGLLSIESGGYTFDL